MTIRENFQRFMTRVSYVVVAGAVVIVVLIDLLYPDLTRLQSAAIAFFVGIGIALMLMVFFRGRFKCPRCNADLRKLRREQLGRWNTDRRMYWDLWEACPKCGVSFDAPYSTGAQR